jgi:hypothetical protein
VAHAAELGFWPCRETHIRAPWPRADSVESFLPRLHTIARDTAAQTTFYVLQVRSFFSPPRRRGHGWFGGWTGREREEAWS